MYYNLIQYRYLNNAVNGGNTINLLFARSMANYWEPGGSTIIHCGYIVGPGEL